MNTVAIAFLWHQHQPYYPDDFNGENVMPWVRLHGTKDYWGMAMHLKAVPEMQATINLVPSLLAQILAYTDQGHEDAHLRVSRLQADGLSEGELTYLLDNFFLVNPERMIRPHRRYNELYQQRGVGVDPALRAAPRFSTRDILDLQVWNNLVWIHPLAFELDPELAEFRKQGANWTEADKTWLLGKQMELLRQVIPLHRELLERGQIELTTTPFYHPILPLLYDKRDALAAMPNVTLPARLESYGEDAAEQIRRAVALHERIFSQPPRGMWPSEGSVSQKALPGIAAAGIKWIATDEEILSRSLDGELSRDAQGFLRNPGLLYRPWRVEAGKGTLDIVFRDHAMSDQIGFVYQGQPAEQAAGDFLAKLQAIGQATSDMSAKRPALVSIILDGENCWEYYPDGGVEFLRTLYRRVVEHAKITPVRMSDYLEEHPATDRLPKLFAGSWISHNFGIWIGHPECNRAWDLVSATREHLMQAVAGKEKTPAQLERAWEELYIAEGSDWFWWFGDSHTSSQSDLFDQLFRKHLENVYRALGEEPSTELHQPIRLARRHLRQYSEPSDMLQVKIDGRQRYFEWVNAGHYAACGSRGTMNASQPGRISDLYFGFDTERLFVRLDCGASPVRQRLADVEQLRFVFLEPAGHEAIVTLEESMQPSAQLLREKSPVAGARIDVAADRILELAIPWKDIAAGTSAPVRFYVELVQRGQAIERIPSEGAIETAVPSAEYELMMWQA